MGGTAPYTYQWNAAAGNQNTQVASNLCAGVYGVTITDANGCVQLEIVTVSDTGAEVLDSDSVDVSCNGVCDGMAIVDFTCTNVPCSIEWIDGATGLPIGQTTDTASNLCAGEYIAQVTNGLGCIAFATITVNEPSPIMPNDSIVLISCTVPCGGEIHLNPTGGNGGYSYDWLGQGVTTSSITGLCAGTYEVEITDANNCVDTFSYTLSDPGMIALTDTFTNANCNGQCDGTITLFIQGGVAPFTYEWFDVNNVLIPTLTDSMPTGLCAGFILPR